MIKASPPETSGPRTCSKWSKVKTTRRTWRANSQTRMRSSVSWPKTWTSIKKRCRFWGARRRPWSQFWPWSARTPAKPCWMSCTVSPKRSIGTMTTRRRSHQGSSSSWATWIPRRHHCTRRYSGWLPGSMSWKLRLGRTTIILIDIV